MNKEFLNWLKEQKYDWDVDFNQKHGTAIKNRTWMLKHIHDQLLVEKGYMMTDMVYNWNELM